MNDTTSPETSYAGGKKGLLVRNAMHLGFGQVATTIIAVTLSAVIGRSLGVADFGTFYVVFTITIFVNVIVDWGQANYVIRETARGRPDEPQFLASAILLRFIGTACAALAAPALALILQYNAHVVLLASLAVLVTLPTAISHPIGYLFRGKDRMDLDMFAAIFSKALTLLAVVLVVYGGGGLTSIILAHGIGAIGSLVACLFLARYIDLHLALPTVGALKDLFRSGAPIAAFALAVAVQPMIEATMLSLLTNAEVVGWYGAARTILGTIIAPATIMAMATFPELSRAARSLPELNKLLSDTARPLLAASAFMFASLFVFADEIVKIIYGGGDFASAAQILRTVAPVMPLLFLDFLLATAANAIGQTRELAVAKLVSIVACAAIGWFAIQICQETFGNGAMGLMLAFFAGEVLMLAAMLFILPLGTISAKVWLHTARAFVAGGLTIFLFTALPSQPLWLNVPSFLVIMAAAIFLVGLLRPHDLKNVLLIVTRRRS